MNDHSAHDFMRGSSPLIQTHLWRFRRVRRVGFTLVVVVSLMALLAVLALGLLGLSSISLRTSSQVTARAEARASARMALVMAIGELQSQAGPDTRITAPANILETSNPSLMGVWKSWEGSDHVARGAFAGRPTAPAYDSKRRKAADRGRFLAWMVSGGEKVGDPEQARSLVSQTGSAERVALVSSGTLAEDDPREVHVVPTPVETTGACAWWVSGENQKALLPKPHVADAETPADWSVISKSHCTADPGPFGLDDLLDDASEVPKVLSRASVELLAAGEESAVAGEAFHDLTVDAVGLLTNSATGGWRKDLSLLSERWSEQTKTGLPLFQLEAGLHTRSAIPSRGNVYPESSMLYPWATYRGPVNTIPIYRHGPVATWQNLIHYMTHYKRVSVDQGRRVTSRVNSYAIDLPATAYGFMHEVRVLPLIARIQWVMSHSAVEIPNTDGLLEPRLLLTPVLTMWNPYNVELAAPSRLGFVIPKALPVALRYSINGQRNQKYHSVMSALNNQPSLGGGSLRFSIDRPFTLMPGETRLFSPASTAPRSDGQSIPLQVGYRSSGGHYFRVKDDNGSPLRLPRTTRIKADAKFDSYYNDRSVGVGIYLDMIVSGRRHLVYRMVYKPEVANEIYKPLDRLAEATLGQCVNSPQPFLSTIFGARTASNTHLASKGFVQSSPLVNYTAMGGKDIAESTIRRHYGGTSHPVNSPFDYSFIRHAPGGDSQLPNASDATGRGYIVTGFNKAEGLSRCVLAELPLRPLASLGELQHWDLRYENPIPPYAINLIGNSDASPLLPSGAVYNSPEAAITNNLQYDDSYCANHLLFDDWFLSSIAPSPDHFGNSGRNLEQTYRDFLEGEEPLANRAYRPIADDRAKGRQGKAEAVFNEQIAPVESWRTVASRLEVEGMFNVNSTSVKAWRALLGHARRHRVPYIRDGVGRWQIELTDEMDHVLNRFSVAGDSEAGKPGSSGAFPEAADFAGFRVVDEELLDELAREVVEEVRERGPFLSLSEFVNRQLSSGKLALAGAIQAALNELEADDGLNPFEALEDLSSRSLGAPDRAGEAEYQFPAAAEGYSSYGMPGWTRQADVLRPLAPVLSVRDDTFTIRAYGDARDADGRILARAVAEAVVRRTREFVDPVDDAGMTSVPTSPANRRFGRRFELVAFRWLGHDEI